MAQKSGRFIVVMPTVTDPGSARSAGTSATQPASSITTSSSPATTSNQYHPPSTNGVSDRSKVKWLAPFFVVVAESTRCERPLAIER